ncbi:hypothetical protein MD484_g3149, partial [Candolleomyces efflorescens]
MSDDHHEKLNEHLRLGGWLPASPEVHEKWLRDQVDKANSSNEKLKPVVQELKDMIDNDPDMYMWFSSMFKKDDPIKDYNQLLSVISRRLTRAPPYGVVGPPIYALLAHAMNTQEGFDAFLAEKLNAQLKKILGVWAKFLESRDSAYVLNDDDGWLSTSSLAVLTKAFDPLPFEQIFKCDTSAIYWGFRSWDDFFTRELRPGIRPVGEPQLTNLISAACESTFYRVKKGAKEADRFWIKGEPYSLRHMLNHDEDYAEKLYGGTVFQGFLAVTSYHRWHSPVTGIIKKIVTVPGTYYVQSPALIGSKGSPYFHSLAFLASVSARMLFFIESSNPKLGLMCFIAVGMVEVSTCEATVQVGQHVNRGDQLGMFHFGGSTHCLVFGPGVDIKWVHEVVGTEVKVRSVIGAVHE